MQIATKNKIPKIASGIAATILCIALGWLFLPKFWFWVSLEIIAALLVAIGCSGEWWLHHHPAGREKKKKDEHHKLESRFIAMVSLGVIMEFFALGHSIKEGKELEENLGQLESTNLVLRANVAALELQVMEAKTNIASIDPRNAPISEMTAFAYFVLMGTNFNELPNMETNRKAQMTIWKDERQGTSLDLLVAEKENISGFIITPTFGIRDRRTYRMQFHSFNFNAASGFEYPVKTIDDVHIVHVDLNFLPRDTEIWWGRVELVVNNRHKMFDVPRQNDTNSNLAYPIGFPCWFAATNGVQSSEKQFLYLRN